MRVHYYEYGVVEPRLPGRVGVSLIVQGFVHMDVAARNMLVHTNNLVKISDFGLVSSSTIAPHSPNRQPVAHTSQLPFTADLVITCDAPSCA